MRHLLFGVVIGALIPIVAAIADDWRIRRTRRQQELERLK